MDDLTIVKEDTVRSPQLQDMSVRLTRRRLLLIGTAACLAAERAHAAGQLRWRGRAFGAEATIALPDVPGAARALSATVAELRRLHDVFSLFRPESQLCRLNASGALDGPDPDLTEVLRIAGEVHSATGGAFDPTIQPLWAAHANAAASGRAADDAEIQQALDRCGWRYVQVDGGRISLSRPGMALTLNGIAQGHAADRVARLLRHRGFTDAMVDTGEIAAMGCGPDGAAWQAAIAGPDGILLRRCALSDRAIATSSPSATVLDPAGAVGHILDPRTGRPGGRWRTVSISAPGAALADALSTAFCVMERDRIEATVARFPGVAIEALET